VGHTLSRIHKQLNVKMKYIKLNSEQDALECIFNIHTKLNFKPNAYTKQYAVPVQHVDEWYVPIATSGAYKCDDMFDSQELIDTLPVVEEEQTEENLTTE
jgi:hypothetical protein